MLGHWFDILIIVIVGLLVFGPKRMIEMGSQVGKMVRELRESTRDLNFKSLLSDDEPPKQPTYSHTASAATSMGAGGAPVYNATPHADETIVESGVEHVEHTEDIAN